MSMDSVDKLLLNSIQSDFPICLNPYEEIGEKLGISEDEVIERIKALKENDIIRRIGANFYPDKLGFCSTLCAAKVPEDKISLFTRKVNSFDGVTHNYIRANEFNVWFTFIAPSTEIIEQSLKEIEEETGVTEILNLPATDVFKVRAKFKL